MKSLTLMTTNDQWAPQFIDRADEANKMLPLHKHLLLSEFCIYWNPNDETPISNISADKDVEAALQAKAAKIEKKNFLLKPSKKKMFFF